MSVAPPSQCPLQIAFTKSPGGAAAADGLTAVARVDTSEAKSKMTSRDVLIGWNATPQAARAVTASSAVAGDTLLSFASEVGADLLVMGCYGHSRASELMLGGALRSVLKSMTLPVLMAR